MTARTTVHGLKVATVLHRFIEEQVLPGTGIDSDAFWRGFDSIVHDLAPKNAALLAERDRLQSELDRWHRKHPGPVKKPATWRRPTQHRPRRSPCTGSNGTRIAKRIGASRAIVPASRNTTNCSGGAAAKASFINGQLPAHDTTMTTR